MNINKLIKDVLTPLGVPVSFETYSGTATTYITFMCYNEQGEAWAENKEIATGFYLQVDIWTKGDYTTLAAQIKSAMETAGFARTNTHGDYDSASKNYHKAIRFVYVADSTQ